MEKHIEFGEVKRMKTYIMNNIRYFPFMLIMSTLSFESSGKDFGVQGQTFEIQEESLLEVITKRLQKLQSDGKLAGFQKDIAEQTKKKALNPEPVKNIRSTGTPKTFYFDPSIIVQEDLKDHTGKVFAQKGQHINPLDIVPLTKALLFINGEDEAQVLWALEKPENSKIILVRGQPLTLEQKHKRRFYFDQDGQIIQKLGINQVPAIVVQEGKKIRIDELKTDVSVEGAQK